MSIDTIALIATLAVGFLGIWYQLRTGQKELRDDNRTEMRELRNEIREQHKEVMALQLNMDKSLAVLADRTPRESYPPPRKARS